MAAIKDFFIIFPRKVEIVVFRVKANLGPVFYLLVFTESYRCIYTSFVKKSDTIFVLLALVFEFFLARPKVTPIGQMRIFSRIYRFII